MQDVTTKIIEKNNQINILITNITELHRQQQEFSIEQQICAEHLYLVQHLINFSQINSKQKNHEQHIITQKIKKLECNQPTNPSDQLQHKLQLQRLHHYEDYLRRHQQSTIIDLLHARQQELTYIIQQLDEEKIKIIMGRENSITILPIIQEQRGTIIQLECLNELIDIHSHNMVPSNDDKKQHHTTNKEILNHYKQQQILYQDTLQKHIEYGQLLQQELLLLLENCHTSSQQSQQTAFNFFNHHRSLLITTIYPYIHTLLKLIKLIPKTSLQNLQHLYAWLDTHTNIQKLEDNLKIHNLLLSAQQNPVQSQAITTELIQKLYALCSKIKFDYFPDSAQSSHINKNNYQGS